MEQLLDPKTPNLLRSPPVLSKTLSLGNVPSKPNHYSPCTCCLQKWCHSILLFVSNFLQVISQTDQDVIHRKLLRTKPSLRLQSLKVAKVAKVNMELEAKFPALPFVVTPRIHHQQESHNRLEYKITHAQNHP